MAIARLIPLCSESDERVSCLALPSRDEVVEVLYRAALEPLLWVDALRRLGAFVAGHWSAAHAAIAFAEGPDADTGWILASAEALSERAYDLRGAGHPLMPSADARLDGAIVDTRRWASAEALAHTTLARALTLDGSVHGLTAVVHQSERLLAVAHLLRRRGSLWGEGAEARLTDVRAHLSRALEVYVRLRRARERALIDRSLLDRIDVGALVLGRDGAIIRCNAAARAMLDRGDGLCCVGDALRGDAPRVDQGIEQAIVAALATAEGGAVETSMLLVPRRSGSRPLLLFFSPFYDPARGAQAAGVTVLVRDTDALQPGFEALLAQLFELTPSEVRVAIGIAYGRTPQALAEHLGLSIETVRSQLKRVYFKTATRGQADLVRLVLGEMPPVMS